MPSKVLIGRNPSISTSASTQETQSMPPDFATDDIPEDVRTTTKRLLANEPIEEIHRAQDAIKMWEYLKCITWWSGHAGPDNLVSQLATITVSAGMDVSRTELERIKDLRSDAICSLAPQYPELVPDSDSE